jgi:hypothetical protein
MILPIIGAITFSISMLIIHTLKNRVSNLIALQYFYITQTFFSAFVQNFH